MAEIESVTFGSLGFDPSEIPGELPDEEDWGTKKRKPRAPKPELANQPPKPTYEELVKLSDDQTVWRATHRLHAMRVADRALVSGDIVPNAEKLPRFESWIRNGLLKKD